MNPETRGSKGVLYFLFQVAERAPMVFPWKAPIIEMMPVFPVLLLASLKANSIASVPLFERKALLRPSGAMVESLSRSPDLDSL